MISKLIIMWSNPLVMTEDKPKCLHESLLAPKEDVLLCHATQIAFTTLSCLL